MVKLLLFILHCYLICCTEPKRSVFLTSWFGTGTKNVKYETIAVNSADENGNLIRRKLNSRRDSNNQIINDCIDIYGTLRVNGEEYERKNGRFKYKCSNGLEIITGKLSHQRCYITDTKQKIKIGDVITKWNMLFKCYLHNNVVQYEEYPCGLPGTQACEIQLNQRSLSSNVPVKPSFGAFSIAQYIYRGNDKVLTGSNTLKLELSRPDG
ncbi:unnamed protein product [Thelazia callipaeda]|uniref:Uncharacterized protein n=1 Tax=Thelazia callipaeda TaxID=103827 RepID=A0A0N5DB22_THECL|nr:unnamed protein product [Thelazia callipaeda]